MSKQGGWNPNVTLKISAQKPPITPRDHQRDAWDNISRHYVDRSKSAGLVVVPTGGGKTVLAAHWLLEHRVRDGGRVLWLAHRRSLLRQALRCFQALGNLAYPNPYLRLIAISSDDCHWSQVEQNHDVVFSSMQTAVLENNTDFLDVFVEQADAPPFIVVDEAHHAPAPGYARLLRRLKKQGCKLLGLTATPIRSSDEDQRRLIALFDESIVFQVDRRELTQLGILAVPAFETVKTRVEVEKDFTAEDYRHLERYGEIGPEVLKRLAKNAPRNRLIVQQYVKHKNRYGPTIVFAADTLACSTLAKEFQKVGVKADYVSYDRSDSQQIITRYQERRGPDVIVNVEMLTEGFDAPHTRTVFIARPTRSEGLLSQMVGRALRGPKAGGNDTANLVTFLDTWEQFNVLDAAYVLGDGEDVEVKKIKTGKRVWVRIPEDLIRAAYRLVMSNIRGHLEGVFQCIPYGWFAWEESFEDDMQSRTVMVYENQRAAFSKMLADYKDASRIPDNVSEDFCLDMLRRYFADVPDPLPRWTDIQALLYAKRNGCEVDQYALEKKKEFDPIRLATRIVDKKMDSIAQKSYLQDVWSKSRACSSIYRAFRDFVEDVNREVVNRIAPLSLPPTPEDVKIVPRGRLREWPEGETGYRLIVFRDAVLANKRHFPNGSPRLGDLRWSERPSRNNWGFWRYSDRSITFNRILNSPDIPIFVLEFLMYHELLHADMPNAGHNPDFRARERKFQASADALVDAERRGIKLGRSAGYWRARADTFLNTFGRHYKYKDRGTEMIL